MTWLELANLLFEKSEALSPRGAHLHLDTAGWLRTWTPHQNRTADVAVRHFAKLKEWPEMEPELAWQIYFRCLFAIENCFEFHARRSRSPVSPEAEQQSLESLLIDSWHLAGIEWAAHRYAPKISKASRIYA